MSSAKFVKLNGDLAIDVGTVNTRIYAKGTGLVLDEPSIVAVTRERGRVILKHVGRAADKMAGREPEGLEIVRPFRSGSVADLEIAGAMIKYFVRQVRGRNIFSGPSAVISVPSGSTSVERRLLKEAAETAGIRRVLAIDNCLAAALGAGLPVTGPEATMVVDVGGGTTDVAVLSLGGIVYAHSTDVAGEAMDEAIIAHVRERHAMLIGRASAEMVKCEIGSAYRDAPGEGRTLALRGRDLDQGVPRELIFSEAETARSLIEPIGLLYEGIKLAIEHTERELGGDITRRGILLTGGGALLHNLDLVIAKATGLAVTIAPNPLTCAVEGAGLGTETRTQLRVAGLG